MEVIKNSEEILSKDDFTYEEFEVPEWGGTLRLRSLSGAQRTIVISLTNKRRDGDGLFERLIIMSAVDDVGKSIFRDDHLDALKARNAAVTQAIGKKILEISGLAPDTIPDIESAEKN